ncbi:hypothetical protein [Ramlibacter sp. WS9]|uniref:hypothetical protein n=1 Tax=Ramlibacter sp. WS9 TaxID=1882741 RepID=UPI0011439995|nr:hypothetical protein [Ramlibacter sp. WS9]ROZ75653.1 hypothetical protein EEB15_13855 [Ramlibacter sp. WS9]
MFDYIRSRNRAAVVFMISLAVFVPALVMPRSGEDLVVRKMILFLSLGAMLISGVWLIVRWDEARRLMRLRSGEGVLARWMIDPARWAWFRHHSNEWDKLENVRPNDADLAQPPGQAGIEVVVTRDGILIGEDFRPLEKDVGITVRADWIEFYQIIPKADGPPLHMVLRLPLQPGSESLAAEVQQAYQRAYHAAKSSRHPAIYVLLFCFVGLPAVTLLIWYVAKVTGWTE